MHKTVYIDVDEEIIGIISKIKKTEYDEVFLVVPKNSLLTQGIVNLKLLKKETEKMGKRVILVTSDEHSKKIIENLGFKTKSKSAQDFIGNDNQGQEAISERRIESDNFSLEKFQKNTKKREIGSSSFYNDEDQLDFSQKKEENSSDLNKTAFSENPFKNKETKSLRVNIENSFGSEYIKNYEAKNKAENEETGEKIKSIEIKKEEPKQWHNLAEEPRDLNFSSELKVDKTMPENPIDDFYKGSRSETEEDVTEPNSNLKNEKKATFKISNRKKFAFFLILILGSVFFSAGFWIYNNWPKMKIELFLREEIKEDTISFKICENPEFEADCLQGNYKELNIKVVESYDSSGDKFSNDKGMARGIVKIRNNYSKDPQPLVATTRILSEEGKLFRLIKAVTVPGMQENQPGIAEAQVVADEIGQGYNIGPSKFTIEGFKGGDKYEKFEVFSEFSMTGGANDTDNKKVKVMTEGDIALAREKTIEIFNNKLENNIKEKLEPGESFIITSIEKEIVKSDSSYAPGDIIEKFNYVVEQKIKVITFNEEKFNQEIKNNFEKEVSENFKFNQITQTDFQKDIANYEEKILDLVVNAKASYWPKVNLEELRRELGAKNNDQIKDYLTELNQIQKAVISYSPSWLSTLPVKEKNVIIETIK